MKKTLYIVILVCFMMPLTTKAQSQGFSLSLGYGSTQKTEVTKLQEFLVNQGLLNVSPTGNYLGLTQDAVKKFQIANNIEATGFFGPLTRAAANGKLAQNLLPQSSISSFEVVSNNSQAATVSLIGAKKVIWKTSYYPANATVNINLLHKTMNSPATYEFVREIAKDTANDGQETWIPLQKEKGLEMYIEVTCSTTFMYTGGCQVSQAPAKI